MYSRHFLGRPSFPSCTSWSLPLGDMVPRNDSQFFMYFSRNYLPSSSSSLYVVVEGRSLRPSLFFCSFCFTRALFNRLIYTYLFPQSVPLPWAWCHFRSCENSWELLFAVIHTQCFPRVEEMIAAPKPKSLNRLNCVRLSRGTSHDFDPPPPSLRVPFCSAIFSPSFPSFLGHPPFLLVAVQ